MKEWQGKTAIVTGAGSGIGRGVSIDLASRGAFVYVTSLVGSEAESVASEIIQAGGSAEGVEVDVTDDQALQSIVERAASERGSLDLIFNNAGMLYVGEFLEMDDDYIDKLIDVNLTAVTKGSLYAYRVMKSQGHGLIVNVASMGGIFPVGTMTVYTATKHAVIGLSNALGGEAEAHGVKVKTICPGAIASELLDRAQIKGSSVDAEMAKVPNAMPIEKAARIIVDGLASKKRKIMLPNYVKLLSLAIRIWPGLGHRIAVKYTEDYRKNRTETADA